MTAVFFIFMNPFDFTTLQSDLNIIFRLVTIVVLAGLLGWERETSGKSAGFRTHMLVGMSSVLFVAIGDIFVFKYIQYNESMRFDPIRIVEAIVTGISFIGAGIIFVSRREGVVKNLTTAASILTTAAVGMIVGLQRYLLAVVCTIIIFIILRALTYLEITEVPKKD
jgi:putative Mg2+ transporter-C (MgtC) family protein